MKKNFFISVIIPVYNVEPYIERCFWSVVSQTYRNYECIFIDDCGTDRSIEILQKLISGYKGDIPLKMVRHKCNRGLSASRNSGMDIASGSFFYFVDSDDYISPDALSCLAEKADDTHDVVCGQSLIIRGKECFLSKIEPAEEISFDLDFFYDSLSKNGLRFATTVWNRLYRREFLETYKIRFCEGVYFEDILFNAEVFIRRPRILTVDHITYFYVIRENSILTSFTEKKFEHEIANIELLKNIFAKKYQQDDPSLNRLIGQRYLRLLIIAPDYGKKVFRKAFDHVHARGFLRKEWKALFFRHKVLYIQAVIPKTLAYFYCVCIVRIYRSLLWNRKV